LNYSDSYLKLSATLEINGFIMRTKRTITELARQLRKNPTESEKKLWIILQKKKLDGFKFLRQKPLIYEKNYKIKGFFIADFYCSRAKLVIEVDGKIHDYQKDYDNERDKVINNLGISIIRINNEEVSNLERVKEKIIAELRKSRLST